jgi:hydrogenase maturation protein HypF
VRERLRLAVRGAVQGVGFRPFVYRLASDLGLDGWVLNSLQGVFIEVEGRHHTLETFRDRLGLERPPRAVIQSLEASWLDPVPMIGFEIRASAHVGPATGLVLPDIATCDDCRREVADPTDRRYRYPFTNCTNCGPRFSIIERLPYDRAHTSMRGFTMCPACQREYDDPVDRRFHAQPNACPACGPRLALWDEGGRALAVADEALADAIAAIAGGRIVAMKGLGGFQLMADATDEDAVRRLRRRKHRAEKPLAVMAAHLDDVRHWCRVNSDEARLLASPEGPIVLLDRRPGPSIIAASVAPSNPALGVLLTTTALHALILGDLGRPVVATSGNISDEPICIDEYEAIERLRGVADMFLVHDRPIVRHVDDSVARMMAGREMVIRRARGYAPLPVPVDGDAPQVLAVGAHLKNTVAVTSGANIFVSQHIGDLESRESSEAFFGVIDNLESLFRVSPGEVVADLHPDYLSSRYAATLGLPVTSVQHHHAHIASCMAENDIGGPVLGVAWDGTGYGTDGTIWGGEFLRVEPGRFDRVASLRPFRLPGGDLAVREPRRSAIGLLYAMAGPEGAIQFASMHGFGSSEARLIARALERRLNTPLTTSAGRLFDAVAALVGLGDHASFEGQAAMALEWAADPALRGRYPFRLVEPPSWPDTGGWVAPPLAVDWGPTIRAVLHGVRVGVPVAEIAACFHETLVEAIVTVAERVGLSRVVLSGGCFQNRRLTERAIVRLAESGFRPYWHQRVPPNDGGIALGQVAVWRDLHAGAAAQAAAPEDRIGQPS